MVLNAFPLLTMVTVVLAEPNDICVKEKGCGSMSGVILDTDAAAAFKCGYSGSRSLGCDQKSNSLPVKLWLKSKAGVSRETFQHS